MNTTEDEQPLGESLDVDTLAAIERGATQGFLSAADKVLATAQLAERQTRALNKIRQLHRPSDPDALGLFTNTCTGCSIASVGIAVQWPCPTIRAIDEAGA